MVSFGGQEKLGQSPDGSPFRGLIQNFQASPPLSYESPPPGPLVEHACVRLHQYSLLLEYFYLSDS